MASTLCCKPHSDSLLNCICRWAPPPANSNHINADNCLTLKAKATLSITFFFKFNWRQCQRRKDAWLGIRRMTYTVFYSQRLWSSPPVTSQSIWKTSKSLEVNCQFTRQSMSNNWFLPTERDQAVHLKLIWLWLVPFYSLKFDCEDNGTKLCLQVE